MPLAESLITHSKHFKKPLYCGFFRLRKLQFMCYCYIIYSIKLDHYHVGSTCDDLNERLRRHNSNHKGYTGKTRHWKLVRSKNFESTEMARRRDSIPLGQGNYRDPRTVVSEDLNTPEVVATSTNPRESIAILFALKTSKDCVTSSQFPRPSGER